MDGWTDGRGEDPERRKTRLDLNTAPRKTVPGAKDSERLALLKVEGLLE
jgi:hypothetical protein